MSERPNSKNTFPRSLEAFGSRFDSEEACRKYLAECRWRDGFNCPKCGHGRAYFLEARSVWKCQRCRCQTSATAGTVMHRSQQPVSMWFKAAFLVASQGGISARGLQKELGLKRYETAWSMLKRLRQAMAEPPGDRLSGTVEVDEASPADLPQGLVRTSPGNTPRVIAAAEVRGRGTGRIRMRVIDDLSTSSLLGFVQSAVVPGVSTVLTDDLLGYRPLARRGYEHLSVVPPGSESAVRALPRVHRVLEDFGDWLMAVYQGVGEGHLQYYLDEFTFRFNRRNRPESGFETLLGLSGAVGVAGTGANQRGEWAG